MVWGGLRYFDGATVKGKFSDDLRIYPITEKRNFLNLHVLKFDPSILDF